MNRFYGKSYRYKDKVIGVCDTIGDGYMTGHIKPSGSLRRVKILSLFDSSEEASFIERLKV